MLTTERRNYAKREARKKAASTIGECLLSLPDACRDKLLNVIIESSTGESEKFYLLLAISSQQIEVSDTHKDELEKVKNSDDLLRQKRREAAAKSRRKKEAWLAFEKSYEPEPFNKISPESREITQRA